MRIDTTKNTLRIRLNKPEKSILRNRLNDDADNRPNIWEWIVGKVAIEMKRSVEAVDPSAYGLTDCDIGLQFANEEAIYWHAAYEVQDEMQQLLTTGLTLLRAERIEPAFENWSFDGKGINDRDAYRSRIATLTDHGHTVPNAGELMAIAPQLVKAIVDLLELVVDDQWAATPEEAAVVETAESLIAPFRTPKTPENTPPQKKI